MVILKVHIKILNLYLDNSSNSGNLDSPINKIEQENFNSYSNNYFMQMTYLEKDWKTNQARSRNSGSLFTLNETPNVLKELSIKDKMKLKRERTKLLLTKTRRYTNYKQDAERLWKNDEDYSKDLNKICDISNEINKNISKSRKTIQMQKNREAAQKSRLNKKLHIERMREREEFLLKENFKIKHELDNIKNNIKKICSGCKSIFNSDLESENKEMDKTNLKMKKNKFQIYQNLINNTNPTNSVSHSRSSSTYKIVTAFLVVVCLLGNLIWRDNLLLSNDGITNNELIPLRVLNALEVSESTSSKYIEPSSNSSKSFSSYNQNFKEDSELNLIGDKPNKNSFYLMFIDYLKMQTVFTPNMNNNSLEDNLTVNQTNNIQDIKTEHTSKNFLNSGNLDSKLLNRETHLKSFHKLNEYSEAPNPNKTNTSYQNMISNDTNEFCLNNNTFVKLLNNEILPQLKFHDNEDYSIRFQTSQNKNLELNLKKNKDQNLLNNCLDCYTKNDYMTFVQEKMGKVKR